MLYGSRLHFFQNYSAPETSYDIGNIAPGVNPGQTGNWSAGSIFSGLCYTTGSKANLSFYNITTGSDSYGDLVASPSIPSVGNQTWSLVNALPATYYPTFIVWSSPKSNITINWFRARVYPPYGLMPSVTLVKTQCGVGVPPPTGSICTTTSTSITTTTSTTSSSTSVSTTTIQSSCLPNAAAWNETYIYNIGLSAYAACDIYGANDGTSYNPCTNPDHVSGVVAADQWPVVTCTTCFNKSYTAGNTLSPNDGYVLTSCKAYPSSGAPANPYVPLLSIAPVTNTTAYGGNYPYYLYGTGIQSYGVPALLGVMILGPGHIGAAYPPATPSPQAGQYGTLRENANYYNSYGTTTSTSTATSTTI
jgi:hypothetical protein